MNTPTRPSRVTLDVDLGVLRDNYRRIAERVAPAGVIAVLKADAYGLGMANVARGLAGCGIAGIAVAELAEGLDALAFNLGVPVIVLGGLLPDEIEPAVEAGLRVPAPSVEAARLLDAAAAKVGRAGGDEPPSEGRHAEAVGVGLEDGDRAERRDGGADPAEVGLERGEVDLEPDAARGGGGGFHFASDFGCALRRRKETVWTVCGAISISSASAAGTSPS